MDEELASPEVFTKQAKGIIDPIQALPLKDRAPKYQEAMAEILPQQIQAGVNVEREKIARDVDVKEAGAKEGQRLSEVQRMEQKGFAEKLDKYAPPTFQPSQEDLTTYAQLGSSIVTLGMMLGGGGKVPAKAALASMTGMLNGWRTGRKELYERESKNFEKESQRLSAVRKSIQDDMNQAMSLWPTKRKDAMALIEAVRFKVGSDSVLGAMLYKGNYDGVMKALESASKLDAAKLKDENALAAKKVDEAARERRHIETMRQRERLAEIRAQSKLDGKSDKGFLKPGAEVTKNYLGVNALSSDMKDIQENLKNPKLRKLISENRLEAFASEELGKIVAQIANEELPSELRQFLIKVRAVRNNYYFTISGKAVTGGEAMRNYGVVAQPADSADVMKDKVDVMIKTADRNILQYQKLYGLPALDKEAMISFRNPDGGFDARTILPGDLVGDGVKESAAPVAGSDSDIVTIGDKQYRKLPNKDAYVEIIKAK